MFLLFLLLFCLAQGSLYSKQDVVKFEWNIQYNGTDNRNHTYTLAENLNATLSKMPGYETLVPVMYLGENEPGNSFVQTILFQDSCPFSHFIADFLDDGALRPDLDAVRLGEPVENVTITSTGLP